MKHLKLFFALFAMLALGVGNAWAESETVTFTNKDWAPWTKITSGSSFESASPSRGVANNGVNGSCKSSKSYSNITKISYVASSNTTGGKVTIKVGETTVGETSIPKANNQTFEYTVDNLSGVITLSVTKPSSKTVYVKSITIETSTATPDPIDPTATFSNGSYTVGQTLDLSTLWTSNSDGAVTYTIDNAGTTGASINGKSFTATAAGTCTVKASQAATGSYNAIEKTATITVTAPTPATITLSEAGQEKTVEGKYVGDSYELPLISTQTCGTKTFVGWSTVEIATPGDKPTSKFYEPGTTVTLVAEQTFYAVFATEGEGAAEPEEVTWSYSFSSFSGTSVQYAEETHDLGSGITINIKGCHINTQLRIYSSDTNNGYVISNKLPGAIKSMSFNVGYKSDNLLVYGSTDGSTWTEVGSIETTTAYADKSIDFGEKNYTYFKLDVKGTQQIRVTKMSITYMSAGGVTTTYSDYTTSCGATPDVIVKTLKSIAVSGMTKEYVEGAEFAFDGTCTATYSVTKNDAPQDDETKTVTPTSVSTPDMTTAGEKEVTVTYTENEVTKTATYNINVKAKPKYTITWNSIGVEVVTEIVQGEPLGELSTVADCPSGKKFMGWTAATEVNSDGSGIVYVKETDIPTSDMTYYAVFAVVISTGEPVTSYKKVTTISDGTYLIAATSGTSSYAYTGQVTGKTYGGYTNVTISSDEIATKPTDALEVTVKVTDGNFSMHDGTSYLYLSAASKNELHFTNTEKVDWILDEGKIKNSSITTENRYLQFNSASGSERFACYKSTQKDAFLYKKVTTTPETKSDYSLDCTIHTEPTWTISKDAIDFADKYVGVSYTETFTISASNLTDDIALAIDGSNFTVSPTSIAKDAEFPQTVTVTYAPTAVGSHNAALNITSGSTLSKAIALTGSATEATIYTLTALADIKPTDKVIIVGTTTNGTYAMSNDKGTGGAPAAVEVTVADNKIATNETNILWNIAKNGDNLTIYPADQTAKWLYCLADDNNGVRVGTGNAKEFTIDKGYLYTIQTTSARHIGIYNNADWRCYKPSGDAIANNIKDQSFAFYVLPNTDPSISVSPASKDFGAVASGETATQEFEITTMNLTQALSAELTGEGFTKSEIEDNKITITFAPTAEQEYTATLTISAGTEASASVTLTGEGVAATYSVIYDKNGAEGDAPTDDTKYVAGSKVTVAGQGDMTMAGYRFAGWKYGDEIYKAGAKFTMPETDVTFVAQWVEKEDFSTGYWVLVNDASELATNDYVVIAAADYNVAMKSYESGKNNCGQVEITKANNLLIWNENVGVFQLTNSSEKYTFRDVNTELYLYAAGGTSNNYLKANSFPTEGEFNKYYWTISIADGKATIKANVTETGARNWLRYNDTESGKLFSCYSATSTQKDIALYKYVTVPVVELHSGDNSALITNVKGKIVNVIINRAFEAGDEWYTLCVPFSMQANVVGKAYQISDLVQKTAGYVEVNLAEKTTIEAGQPYLIKPNKTVDKLVVNNVTIVNTTGESIAKSISGLSVAMQGVINGAGNTDGLYWVGNSGYLYNDNVDKLGLRTYFNISTSSGIAPRMRVVAGENVETGVEDLFTTEAPAKVIENGQLIIIRDGVKYNVQGQKL